MGKIAYKKNALQTILGHDVLVVESKTWQASKHVSIQTWLVNYPEQHLPNQYGLIISPKQCNDALNIELIYLKHEFSEKSTAKVFAIQFNGDFFDQWESYDIIADEVLNDNNAGLQIPFNVVTQSILNDIEQNSLSKTFSDKLQQLERCIHLLALASSQAATVNDHSAVPACSFLNSNAEREKVFHAKEILDAEFDQMIPIKELSRRVAINECYLKKGFKALFGNTINEYQQQQRISRAKTLLQTESYTVSEVANMLGYSSISHFSTAFKKATNMKPCELLK
jgi:AraC-like DNA-binding protein